MKKIILFLFLSFILFSCGRKSEVPTISENDLKTESIEDQNNLRQKLKNTYTSQIGVKEKGKNSGDAIFKYQKAAGIKSGMPWCASFVFWCIKQNYPNFNLKSPAQAASWFVDKSKIIVVRGEIKKMAPQSGDIIGIVYNNRVGHAGFYDSENEKFYITVEGNTNDPEGTKRGEGVYKLKRIKRQVNYISNHID